MAQSVPNTFTAGDPALAAEVNENFASVDGRIDGILTDGATLVSVVESLFAEINFLYTTVSAPAVSTAFCPTDSIAISANCHCEGDGTTINFGVLFGCEVGTLGAVAACFPEALTANLALADPTAFVTAVCVSAILVDGTVATVTTSGKPAMQKIATFEETTEQIALRFQNSIEVHRNAMQLKQKD